MRQSDMLVLAHLQDELREPTLYNLPYGTGFVNLPAEIQTWYRTCLDIQDTGQANEAQANIFANFAVLLPDEITKQIPPLGSDPSVAG